MSALAIRDLHFRYPGDGFGLRLPNLELARGASLAILGPSGGGKTTLLRLMAGLLQPQRGEIRLDDTRLDQLTEAERRRFRLTRTGLIFQDFALLDYLTVAENLLLPARFAGTAAGAEADARELAEHLDIGRHWRRLTRELSQGERQRVAIARALAHRPQWIFADEPTASLDAVRRNRVIELLQARTQAAGACLVLVTHDQDLLPRFPNQLEVEALTA